jgi:hypothetical protein
MLVRLWRRLFRRKPWWHDPRIIYAPLMRRDAFNLYDATRRK